MTYTSELRNFDRELHASEALTTGGLSPASLVGAYVDWAIHLVNQPGRRLALAQEAWEDGFTMWKGFLGISHEKPCAPKSGDHRFDYAGWQHYPYSLIKQAFLSAEHWWESATVNVQGVSANHERIVSFTARQLLDMLAPSNNPILNPEVLAVTMAQRGENIRTGLEHFLDDLAVSLQQDSAPLPLQPGKEVAITAGAIVFRNHLIELIQYAPKTDLVRPEPLLIVPAWIMKYYILDLRPEDSLINFLVQQGYSVFCISWRNPGPADREVNLEDYRKLGVMKAIDAICAITGSQKLHATGYCLGGTLLAVAAAAMARDHDPRIASITLLAAQTDFTEAGELQLFINEAQLAFLDDIMWQRGYLGAKQMAGAFQMLRSNDLVWSRLVRRYFLGLEDEPNDLMSWNMDATRMPYRMHSEYLWHFFQNNNLAEGRFPVAGRPISLNDIEVPFFVVGTETDHVAPWRSVHKIHLLNAGAISFVLTSGGHNAGIVSEPGHANRRYKFYERRRHGKYLGPDDWLQVATPFEGSWWPAWARWLNNHSSAATQPPAMGKTDAGYKPLCAAPGTYVLQR